MIRPTVALFGNPDGVSIRLIETLIANLCSVKILSVKEELWRKSLTHISQKNYFQIVSPEKTSDFINFEYLILLDLDLSLSNSEALNNLRLAAAQSARILVVLPFVVESLEAWQQREKIRGLVLKKIPEAGIVYVGELYGPRYSGFDKNFITRNITSAILDSKLEYEDASLFPISIESFCRYLTRSMFSFGSYGKEIAVYSQEISGSDFLSTLSIMIGDTLAKTQKDPGERQEVLGIKQILVKSDLEKSLKETVLWLNQYVLSAPITQKRNKNSYFLKKGALIGTIILILAPFLLGLAASFTAFLSINSIKKGKIESASRNLIFARSAGKNAQKFFYVYGQIPLVSKIYGPFISTSNILVLSTEIGLEGVGIIQKSRELAKLVLGDDVYDPTELSNDIAVRIDSLYQKTSFLSGEIRNLDDFTKKLVLSFVSESALKDIREKLQYSEILVQNLPEILGKGSPKNYLILFQNNMELRPTGGFIGSFAIVSFDTGRLIDINVSDVYAADGQLKGHVEPPAPIKKYLGEANWFLRDSNWNPDFPISAERAEWFLDKEIDKRVDGVVAVDLEVAKGLLAATGPVVLPDFNQVFDYTNLYEVLQSEVESDFFPGSQKKASILTALTREVLNRISSLPEDKYVPVAKQMANSLNERHIQIYFNDDILESAISRLGYSGELTLTTSCLENCFNDWYSAIDANVGVTKANYFIERDFNLNVAVLEGKARKTLEITYKNNANPALGQLGRYRTYTRVFAPKESVFEKVKIENLGAVVETDLEVESEGQQISGGVNVEISPGQTKKLIFTWEIPLPQNLVDEGYKLFIRKQAGTLADPLDVSVLTEAGVKSYNTTLVKDFVWTQKP